MSQSGSRSWPAVRRVGAVVLLAILAAASAGAAGSNDALLNQVVQAAEEKLRTCGPDLHARFGVEAGSLRAITYADGRNIRACRDLNNVALGQVGEPLIVLCTPQFWRKAEQSGEEAAYFLIHEYLHTRGLDEWPHGGKFDSVSITRMVRETCAGDATSR